MQQRMRDQCRKRSLFMQKKLLSIEKYHRLLSQERSIADLLALSGVEDPELPLIQPSELAWAADLS